MILVGDRPAAGQCRHEACLGNGTRPVRSLEPARTPAGVPCTFFTLPGESSANAVFAFMSAIFFPASAELVGTFYRETKQQKNQ